jgi:dTDP-4-amino-4,6-dideoxygalactose transaminase
MPELPGAQSTFWLTALTIDPSRTGVSREQVREALAKADIEARPVWKPMHLQAAFRGCHVRGGGVAKTLFEHGLCLPSGSSLSDDDRARVAAQVSSRLRS